MNSCLQSSLMRIFIMPCYGQWQTKETVCTHAGFCVVLVGGCCMLSVCVEFDVRCGPHMGAGGRAVLSGWLCTKRFS